MKFSSASKIAIWEGGLNSHCLQKAKCFLSLCEGCYQVNEVSVRKTKDMRKHDQHLSIFLSEGEAVMKQVVSIFGVLTAFCNEFG